MESTLSLEGSDPAFLAALSALSGMIQGGDMGGAMMGGAPGVAGGDMLGHHQRAALVNFINSSTAAHQGGSGGVTLNQKAPASTVVSTS